MYSDTRIPINSITCIQHAASFPITQSFGPGKAATSSACGCCCVLVIWAITAIQAAIHGVCHFDFSSKRTSDSLLPEFTDLCMVRLSGRAESETRYLMDLQQVSLAAKKGEGFPFLPRERLVASVNALFSSFSVTLPLYVKTPPLTD